MILHNETLSLKLLAEILLKLYGLVNHVEIDMFAPQQLYLFGGLLSMYAVINLAPLKVLGRVAQIGFFIHIVGTLLVYHDLE